MKNFLIVSRNKDELQRYYQFIANAINDIVEVKYCGSNHAHIETNEFNVDIMVENYYPIPTNTQLDNFIYAGNDKEYESMLKSLLK